MTLNYIHDGCNSIELFKVVCGIWLGIGKGADVIISK